MNKYATEATELLKRLIATPSVSRDERRAADEMGDFLKKNVPLEVHREANNQWVIADGYDPARPTLLLNAHIDTVRPSDSWQHDPFTPTLEGDRLYGLGSNDCGGGLVALLQTFRILSKKPQPFNLVYLASAEEEVSGRDGIERALPLLPKIDVAIVGEPTGMQPAIAEKGLMVIDGYAHGRSGHAARNEGINAIYEALDDLVWIRDYRFRRDSDLLGPTTMKATVIEAGRQHNVVPDECHFVVDVRSNELYTNEELFDFIDKKTKSELRPRSFRLGSSHIAQDHPLVRRCLAMGMQPYGSPTLSDQALMRWPSLKLGPGDSARSHTADEYIKPQEIADAIEKYVALLDGLSLSPSAI